MYFCCPPTTTTLRPRHEHSRDQEFFEKDSNYGELCSCSSFLQELGLKIINKLSMTVFRVYSVRYYGIWEQICQYVDIEDHMKPSPYMGPQWFA